MKHKIICLLGGACTGKDTVRNGLLMKQDMLNVHSAVSTTTRPKRLGEEDGIHYHFIGDSRFKELEDEDAFVEVRTYEVADGSIWRYGYTYEEINQVLEKGHVLLIVDLEGFQEFKSLYGEDCMGIYLDIDRDIRIQRYLNRDELTFDMVEEAVRRIKDDDERAFLFVENWVDKIFKGFTNSEELITEVTAYLLQL